MKKTFFAALCAAVLALALFAGCEKTPSSSSAAPGPSSEPQSASESAHGSDPASVPADPAEYVPDWRVEPYLEAARIAGLPEDGMELNQQMVFTHLGIQTEAGGGWQFLNFETGDIFPDQQSTSGFWGTFGGSLPFYNYGTFTFDMDDTQLAAWAQQLSDEQGIGLDYQGHGTMNVNPPALADGEWLEFFVYPEGLSTFDPAYPLEFSGAANVALIVDVNNGDWQAATAPIRWMYAGSGSVRCDGMILVDKNGERITDTVYEDAMPYSDGVAAVKLDGKWGYVDEAGRPIADFGFEPMLSNDPFSRDALVPYSANEGLIPVKRDGKCGVIDTQGNVVVPLRFEDITSVHDGAVWAKSDGKWGILNV